MKPIRPLWALVIVTVPAILYAGLVVLSQPPCSASERGDPGAYDRSRMVTAMERIATALERQNYLTEQMLQEKRDQP